MFKIFISTFKEDIDLFYVFFFFNSNLHLPSKEDTNQFFFLTNFGKRFVSEHIFETQRVNYENKTLRTYLNKNINNTLYEH